MAIITLTTDFGLKDHYVGALKGSILKQLSDVVIIDISHQIEKYNIQDAAYILKEAYADFPLGTIHVIGLLTELNTNTGYVAVEANGHFFIGADNGIFSLLFDEMPTKIIEILIPEKGSWSFPARDVFAKAACLLASGQAIETLGNKKLDLISRIPFRAASMGDNIKGSVVYVDSYGNAITNISRSLFESIGKNRVFIIELARSYSIERISEQYSEVPEGEILALFNGANQIEIAMRNGNVNTMLNLKLNDSITIRFS